MKNSKFMTITVLVLLLSIILTSCSGKKSTSVIDTVFNENHKIEYGDYTTTGHIAELDGYYISDQYKNIVIFKKGADDNAKFNIYNLSTKKIILSLTDPQTTYAVESISSGIIWISTISTISPISDGNSTSQGSSASPKVTVGYPSQPKIKKFFAYDFAGNLVTSSHYRSSQVAATRIADLVMFNGCLYKQEEDGTLKKIEGLDLYSIPSGRSFSGYSEKYYCTLSYGYVYIYDQNLKPAYSFTLPSYVQNLTSYMLNDGKVLVQGTYIVEENSDKYDYYEVTADGKTVKYKLYHLLIDPETKKTNELALGCYVNEVKNAYTYNMESKEKQIFGNSFENIAIITPITDKRLDLYENAKDIVLMDNKAGISDSLKFIENQTASLPQKIADNRYIVGMIDNSRTLIDENGTVIDRLYNYKNCYGSYIVTNNAIYDLDLNPIFYENNHEERLIIGGSEDTVYVKERGMDQIVYYSFRNGTKTEICRFDNNNTGASFEQTEFGYIINSDGKYVWYNNSGTELISTYRKPYYTTAYESSHIYWISDEDKGWLCFCIYK